MPGDFKGMTFADQLEPIAQAWRDYARSYRVDVNEGSSLVRYMMRTPDRFRAMLGQVTRASPEDIERIIADATDFARFYSFKPPRYGLDEFDYQNLEDQMRQLVDAERHRPVERTIPVTLLQPAGLGTYQFDEGGFRVNQRRFDSFRFLPGNWEYVPVEGRRQLILTLQSFEYPRENAQALARAIEANTHGQNVFFVGIEAQIPVSGGGEPRIDRVIFATDPMLTQAFMVRDYEEARRQKEAAKQAEAAQAAAAEEAKRQAEAEAAAAAKAAEAEGFGRETLAPRMETAGLTLGKPPADEVQFIRHEWIGKNYPISAMQAFFHAEVPGGQVAFLTADSTATGAVVYLARAFKNEDLTREALMKAGIDKLGEPSAKNGSTQAFWWGSTVPADRQNACRLDLAEVGLGNAVLRNNTQWSRHPLFIDINAFETNCGLVAHMNTFSKKYAAADTGWFHEALKAALAEQERAQSEKEAEATSEIDF